MRRSGLASSVDDDCTSDMSRRKPDYHASDKPCHRKYMKPPVFGLEMHEAVRKYSVCFDNYIDLAQEEAANCRSFDATGVGACLLTDYKKSLPELFEVDSEVVAYSTIPECVEKATWLLNNPGKAVAIGKAGHWRVLSTHTFSYSVGESRQYCLRNTGCRDVLKA